MVFRCCALLVVIGVLHLAAHADPVDRILATHAIQPELTVFQVVQKVPRAMDAVVEWRGMATEVQGGNFTLRVGPYKVTIRNATLPFKLHDGDAIRVTGRVLETGSSPVLQPLVVAPAQVHTSKGIGWNPNVVTPREAAEVSHWYEWILSFNRRLSPDTAGLYASTVFRYSRPYRLDPRLVLAVVGAESAFEKDAVSNVGAIGLGQLMPDTALQMGVINSHDPIQNLQGAIRLLTLDMRRWQGASDQVQRALASYNAGVGAVEQYNGIPPYAETQAYVVYVLSLYRELGGL